MKKCFTILLFITLITGVVFSQSNENGLKISGEIKTGLFWYERQIGDAPATSEGYIHNAEDDTEEEIVSVGKQNYSQGRFRLNLQYDHDNIGMKLRFEQDEWRDTSVPKWAHAFAYGSFINEQLKVSIGRLGDSPWGAGGPEMWEELDTRIGIRFEITPNILPGLNVGFVLNDMDGQPTQSGTTQTLAETLQESVLGINYAHDYFLARFAYRLDSMIDWEYGDQFLFRVEERIIQKYLPGFQIWANGYYVGLRTGNNKDATAQNWLYAEYAPDNFTAQLRLGLDLVDKRQTFYARPSFYYNFFGNVLNVGAAFEIAQDYGDGKLYKDSKFLRWFIEPQVRVNLNSNAYLALVYHYRNQYTEIGKDTVTKVQFVNLRAVYTF